MHNHAWRRYAPAFLAVASLLLSAICVACGKEEGGDGGGGSIPGPPPPGGFGDACVPGKHPCPDTGPEDMGPTDMGPADMGPMDSGEPECDCPPRECRIVTCLDLICDYYTFIPDGNPCFGGSGTCVGGVCVLGEDEHCDEPITSPRVIASRPLGTDFPSSARPAVGVDDDGRLLFVWTAEVDGTLEVHGRRFDEEALGLDCQSEPLVLATGIELGWDTEPTVTGLDGGGWVAVWTSPTLDGDLGAIAYRTVSVLGELGPTRLANVETLFHQHEPRIIAVDDELVIAWTDESGQSPLDEFAGIRARRFELDGSPIGTEFVVPATTAGDQRQPAIAASGTTWLAAWTEAGASLDTIPTVRVRRFAGSDPIDVADIELSTEHGASPSVSAPRPMGDYLVVWESREADPDGDVRARVVHDSGDPLDGTMVLDVADEPDLAEVGPAGGALDGAVTLVAWHEGPERRDVGLAGVGGSLPAEADIIREYLSADGLERDVSVVQGKGGAWITWSDDGSAGELTAYRSVLASFLLPEAP